MARDHADIPIERSDIAAPPGARAGAEPSLGDLFRQLTTDTGELVRQEVSLAKAEMRQVGATLARDGAKIGVALGLAHAGVLALTAFLIAGLGGILRGHYWLAALIVGVLLLAIGGVMARSAVNDVKRRGVTPDQTAKTLSDDAAWAKQEAREFKRELTQ